MTLATCVFTQNHIIHVSDRRTTMGNQIHRERRNKTLLVACHDAVAIVSFCGVAEVFDHKKRKHKVDDVIADNILRIQGKRTLGTLHEAVKNTLCYRDFSQAYTSIHIVGFRWKRPGTEVPFFIEVSRTGDKFRRKFSRGWELLSRLNDQGILPDPYFSTNWPSPDQMINLKQKMLQRHADDDPGVIAKDLVDFIKVVNRDHVAVGGDLMAIILPRSPAYSPIVNVEFHRNTSKDTSNYLGTGSPINIPAGFTPWIISHPRGYATPTSYYFPNGMSMTLNLGSYGVKCERIGHDERDNQMQNICLNVPGSNIRLTSMFSAFFPDKDE